MKTSSRIKFWQGEMTPGMEWVTAIVVASVTIGCIVLIVKALGG